jgi:anaphase-promoting complex subunit 4
MYEWRHHCSVTRADISLAVTDSTTSLLDLILLLLVGRSSEAVSDYIGSGEQMTERVCALSTAAHGTVQACFIGLAKVGIHSRGSSCETSRFFRIARCSGMPTFSLVVGRDLGLVAAVSLPYAIILRSPSPPPLIRPRIYGVCELNKDDISQAMTMTGRAIFSASWLSAAARRELSRFREFMKWLRFGKHE